MEIMHALEYWVAHRLHEETREVLKNSRNQGNQGMAKGTQQDKSTLNTDSSVSPPQDTCGHALDSTALDTCIYC